MTNELTEIETAQAQIRALESVLVERVQFARRAGLQFNGDRDVWKALGYADNPGFHDYCSRYRRQDVAARIIDQPVRATWRETPLLVDTDDEENDSPFEEAWLALVGKKRIVERFRRVDTLASLGEFAVLLVGLAGQDDFEQPLIRGAAGEDGLLYLTPFSQGATTVDMHDDDQRSPRYGWPTMYSLQTQIATGKVTTQQSLKAHWSRVVHVTQNNLENDVQGTPSLERVYNLLFDLLKVVGASAETYWQLANSPLHANLDPKSRPLSETEKAKVKDQVDELLHGQRRNIFSSGMDLGYLATSVADPRGPFEVIMKLISSATGIPVRMLTGSEAGELASSQDEKNFQDRIAERQTDYAEPSILRPTVDILIEAGVLPEPREGEYQVQWGSLADADESERAETTETWARAAQGFSNASSVIAPSEARERYFGLPADLPEEVEVEPEENNNNDEDEENNNT